MTRNRNWIITIPLAAVGVAYLYFVFLPTSRQIDSLRRELASKRAYVTQDAALKVSIASTEEKLAEAQRYVANWKKESPGPGELSPVFAAINLCAKKSGAKLDNFDPQPVVEFETLRKVPLRLGVHGSFAEVHQLIRSLEELPQVLWVENMRLEGTREAGKPLHAEINLAVFAANPNISD